MPPLAGSGTLPSMTPATMHAGQVPTTVPLVRGLLARQFPEWSSLPVVAVDPAGTDHDLYRLGDRLVVRLPVIESATGQAIREARWLPELAPHLPVAVPVPVARGAPDEWYPFGWSVYEWLPGVDPRGAVVGKRAAVELASFVRALQRVGTTGAPSRRVGDRGGPLGDLDDEVRSAVTALGDRIDAAAVLRSWEESAAASPWTGADVWLHGDLLPGNLLLEAGRLTAVIDFGMLTVGDPAADLLPAWNLVGYADRRAFLTDLDPDEATRLRGRGWALAQSVIALPYYWTTNPGMVAQAQHAMTAVLTDA